MRPFMNKAALVAALIVLSGVTASRAATIVIQNMDGAGEGFNDPTAAAPVGGNPGTTRGAQRLNAFTYAANLWATRLQSNVTIVVSARMDPQTCTMSSAILGSAGATTAHRDFVNAPVAATFYTQPLANARAGFDLSPANPDISATFNSNLNGSAGCLGGVGWYYGYDQNPGSDIDFVSVVVHELGHGLGFQCLVDLLSGTKFNGFNDAYMLKLNRSGGVPADYPSMTNAQRISASTSDPNLRWNGANVTAYHPFIPLTAGTTGGLVRVHAPAPAAPGSSVSHFSTALVPNDIMEPSYTGPNHNINLTLELMKDIGWIVIPNCAPGTTTFNDTDTLTVAQTTTTWDFKIEITNTGAFEATGVNATIISGPAWLVVTDPNDSYPDLGPGNSAFSNSTYTLDVTNWPGGAFSVSLQIYFTDDCGLPHNQTVSVGLQPATLPTPVAGQTFPNRLEANMPNPFNPSTTIHYQLAESGPAALRIYDVSGGLVRTLVNRSHNVGAYETRWDGRDDRGLPAASGVYFYRLESNRFTQTRRMVLLK